MTFVVWKWHNSKSVFVNKKKQTKCIIHLVGTILSLKMLSSCNYRRENGFNICKQSSVHSTKQPCDEQEISITILYTWWINSDITEFNISAPQHIKHCMQAAWYMMWCLKAFRKFKSRETEWKFSSFHEDPLFRSSGFSFLVGTWESAYMCPFF